MTKPPNKLFTAVWPTIKSGCSNPSWSDHKGAALHSVISSHLALLCILKHPWSYLTSPLSIQINTSAEQTDMLFNTLKQILTRNVSRIIKKAQIYKNSMKTEFYKVYKKYKNSTTHKTERFLNGVWGLSPQAFKKLPPLVTVYYICIISILYILMFTVNTMLSSVINLA